MSMSFTYLGLFGKETTNAAVSIHSCNAQGAWASGGFKRYV
jgi:hypothetical protein